MEGLSYLTLDADVKDDFVEDEPALKAMFDLAKVYLLSLFPHSSDSINISQSFQSEGAVTPTPQYPNFSSAVFQRFLRAATILPFSLG